MTAVPDPGVVDVVFRLKGRTVPTEHAHVLRAAVCEQLPWLEQEPLAGIHQIFGASSMNGWQRPEADALAPLVLSRRTALTLRLPEHRAGDAVVLTGKVLDLAGHHVEIGQSRAKGIEPAPVLFARQVLCGESVPEADFLRETDAQLRERLPAMGTLVCGLTRLVSSDEGPLTARSLMLTGLRPESSARLQREGFGGGRLLGCGLFSPHKGVGQLPAHDFD